MDIVRNAIAARCETIENDRLHIGNSRVVDNTREYVILDVRQWHLDSLILKETNRRVSHDCSNTKYLDHSVLPSFSALSRRAAHEHT